MIEINLLDPKKHTTCGNVWKHFTFYFNNKKNWGSVTVRKTETPTRPSYYEISKVKDLYLSEDN